MKKTMYIMGLLALIFTACEENNSTTNSEKPQLSNDADSFSYFYGLLIGSEFQMTGIDDANYDLMSAGIMKGATADSSTVDPRFAQYYVMGFFDKKEKKKMAGEQEVVREWVEENRDMNEMTLADEGYYYRVITASDGKKPGIQDKVRVHYTGKLLDGTVFDSSVDGEPAEFKVGGVIKGWTYGLQQMAVGSKYELIIPAYLAYGPAAAAGGVIKPNSPLMFEVELLEVLDPADTPEQAAIPFQ